MEKASVLALADGSVIPPAYLPPLRGNDKHITHTSLALVHNTFGEVQSREIHQQVYWKEARRASGVQVWVVGGGGAVWRRGQFSCAL